MAPKTTLFEIKLRLCVGEDNADSVRSYQPFIACEQNSVQHRLIQQEVAHPFGDDNVNFGNRKFNFFYFSLKDRDDLNKQRKTIKKGEADQLTHSLFS